MGYEDEKNSMGYGVLGLETKSLQTDSGNPKMYA